MNCPSAPNTLPLGLERTPIDPERTPGGAAVHHLSLTWNAFQVAQPHSTLRLSWNAFQVARPYTTFHLTRIPLQDAE
jgi:hypothetical protein